MGWSSHHPIGLIYYEPQQSYRGYTITFNSRSGYYANLIDMEGRVCHRWETSEGIGYPVLPPTGNLLLRTHPPSDCGGAPGVGLGEQPGLGASQSPAAPRLSTPSQRQYPDLRRGAGAHIRGHAQQGDRVGVYQPGVHPGPEPRPWQPVLPGQLGLSRPPLRPGTPGPPG